MTQTKPPAPTSGSVPSPAPCPICKKPAHQSYKPFCSKRCADLDLGRWLGGGYVLPGDAPLEGIGETAGDTVGDMDGDMAGDMAGDRIGGTQGD